MPEVPLARITARRRLRQGAWSGLRVHLIGVGGCGMNGAACLLAEAGAVVSGSDMNPFEGVGRLTSRGVRVAIGHRAEQLTPDVELVVISAAIPESNPELRQARASGIPVVKYAQLLGSLMRARAGVAIAGTHGKSTTTALCAHLFRASGLDASFVVGACVPQLQGNGGYGRGSHLIVEACEYDRSFLQFTPRYGVVLNVEPDHFDCYRSFGDLVEAFNRFARNVRPDGLFLCNAEDHWALRAAGASRARVATFGFEAGAHWQAREVSRQRGCSRFEVWHHGGWVLTTELSIPGRYNVSNALAAIALACEEGADPEAVAQALPRFEGIGRRLTWRGAGRGVTVVDDYAHHPTEIRLTLEAARARYEPRRTRVIFQPHQYSRTLHLLEQFAESFALADEVIVPDVYGAREQGGGPPPQVGSKELASLINERGRPARHLPTLAAVTEHLASTLAEGDLVLTMGAGDVWKVADELVGRIQATS